MVAAREGTVPKRYSNDIFLTGLLFRKKTRTKTNDRKLYPVVVTIVDKVAMRVKTRSLDTVKSSMSSGGSEADNNPFQRLEPLSALSLTSLDDRMEKFKGNCTEK